MKERYAIVLAAGKGTRMKSLRDDISKVSYPILKTPLLKYVLMALHPLGLKKKVVVVGFGGETSSKIAEKEAEIVWQKEQKGTGHAIMMAAPNLSNLEGNTIVCCGDTPLLTTQTLGALLDYHENNHNDLTILTAVLDNPHGYGRIIVDEKGQVEAIREQKDCSKEEEAIKTINAGVYVFDNKKLFDNLDKLSTENAAHEYYLTDMVGIFNRLGYKVGHLSCPDFQETLGVNDRVQLAEAAKIIRKRINTGLMFSGVSIEDPDSTYIGPEVEIGQDTVIAPNVHIYGTSKIGQGNEIGPDSYFENVEIGNGNTITHTHLSEIRIGNDNDLGPYLRARKGVVIGNHTRIGNFNELKNSNFGDGSKCAHLSYVGDADVGKRVNIGCGTIVANYDGVNKFRSKIKDGAFVGSGTILISPVTLGEKSLSAAGSVIAEDVPDHAMGIARSRQVNKEGYADLYRLQAEAKKKNKKE